MASKIELESLVADQKKQIDDLTAELTAVRNGVMGSPEDLAKIDSLEKSVAALMQDLATADKALVDATELIRSMTASRFETDEMLMKKIQDLEEELVLLKGSVNTDPVASTGVYVSSKEIYEGYRMRYLDDDAMFVRVIPVT